MDEMHRNDESAATRSPWLVAAWPGLGAVAQIALTHLAAQLPDPWVEELETARFHEVNSIRVHQGLLRPMRPPRTLLHGWHDPKGKLDLLVLWSESQPTRNLRGYARTLLERAKAHGARRVVTFAAMGTQVHPSTEPRVFAIATDAALLREAVAAGAAELADGEIAGMNGVLLGAAADVGLPALGLLGEMPFFAAGMPNPKSAAAVLRSFRILSGFDLDLRVLDEHARHIEPALLQQLPVARRAESEPSEDRDEESGGVSPRLRERIEALFQLARAERDKALELKALLDEHGLFRDYEDRFLDLFRNGS